ncbi:MAG: PQQ-like beta-propeller repeat protein [Pirellulales bacterium]|nr:PQQ-like beta-propeller repeat protein [Pirellulales bacterium]
MDFRPTPHASPETPSMFRFDLFFRFVVMLTISGAAGNSWADWPQWRGPNRNGYVPCGPLIETLPPRGLAPIWKVESFSGGSSGGWSSPVISEGRVYLYAHTKTKNPEAENLGPAKFPWLPPDKRVGMTEQEYREYEVKRRDENEQRAQAYRFDERLLCLDLDSGHVVWDRTHSSKYTRFTHSGTPCVAGRRVFVLGAQRTARCYDALSGELLWTRKLPGDFRDEYFSSSFAVSGSTALVSCGPITALEVDSGKVIWQGEEPLDYQSHSSPAVWSAPGQPVVIVNTNGGVTKAYRISDGKKLWQFEGGAGQSTPLIAGELVLVYGASRKSGLSAYRLSPERPEQQPELVWRFQRAADSGSTPVVRGDAVFVQGDKRLAKVNLADGATIWQTTMSISNPRYTSLVAAGNQVFYAWQGILSFHADGDDFQQIYAAKVDADQMLIEDEDLRKKLDLALLSNDPDGQSRAEKIWQSKAVKSGPLDCSTPALSDGRIVIRLREGVACFDLRR